MSIIKSPVSCTPPYAGDWYIILDLNKGESANIQFSKLQIL